MDGLSTPFNDELSQVDIDFIKSSVGYPELDDGQGYDSVILPVHYPYYHLDEVDSGHPERRYEFSVDDYSLIEIETNGFTDMVMTLWDDNDNKIAFDDDSGEGYNSKIQAQLAPGTYYVVVRHYYDWSEGRFGIRVRRIR